MAVHERKHAVRVVADNGTWWLLNVAPTAQRDVEASILDRTGDRQRVDALCTPLVASTDQLSAAVPPELDPQARSRLEIAWTDRAGRRQSYTIDLPNDGLRRSPRFATAS